jgi:hypothetical protein
MEWMKKAKKQKRGKKSLWTQDEIIKMWNHYEPHIFANIMSGKHDEMVEGIFEKHKKKMMPKYSLAAGDFETIDGYPVKATISYQKKSDKGELFIVDDILDGGLETLGFMEIVRFFLKSGRHSTQAIKDKDGNNTGTEYRWSLPIYEFFNLKFDQSSLLKLLPNDIIYEILAEGEATVYFKNEQPTTLKGTADYHIKITALYKKWLMLEFSDDFTHEIEVREYIPMEDENGEPILHTKGKKKGKQKHETKMKTVKAKVKTPLQWFDIMQFYGTSLNNAAKQYLNENKVERLPNGEPLEIWRMNEEFYPEVDDPHWIIANAHLGEDNPLRIDDYEPQLWSYGKSPAKTTYGEYYADIINEYAMLDSNLTLRLALNTWDEYFATGIPFSKPFSPANLTQKYIIGLGFDQTTNILMDDKHNDHKRFVGIMDAAYESFFGGIFDTASIGYHGDVRAFDIKSSYPSSMIYLPSMTEVYFDKVEVKDKKTGKMKEVMVKKERINGSINNSNKEAVWLEWVAKRKIMDIGFVKCSFTFKEGMKWYPLQMRVKGVLSSPQQFEGWITVPEWIEAMKYPHTDYQFHECWFHKPKTYTYPYRDAIKTLYDIKESAPKNTPRYNVSKASANSAFGKTSQEIEEWGSLWNKCYASMITGMGRARLIEFNAACDYEAILMATDGIIVPSKNVPLTLPEWDWSITPEGDDFGILGQWEEDTKSDKSTYDAIILGSGVYSLRSNDPIYTEDIPNVYYPDLQFKKYDYKTAVRGSAAMFLRNSEANNWFEYAELMRSKTEVNMVVPKPTSIKMAGMRNKQSHYGEDEWWVMLDVDYEDFTAKKPRYDKTNIFNDEPYTLTPFMTSFKRKLPDAPETFGDLLTETFPCVAYTGKREILMERYKTEYALSLLEGGLI